jgi:hypothetical protein
MSKKSPFRSWLNKHGVSQLLAGAVVITAVLGGAVLVIAQHNAKADFLNPAEGLLPTLSPSAGSGGPSPCPPNQRRDPGAGCSDVPPPVVTPGPTNSGGGCPPGQFLDPGVGCYAPTAAPATPKPSTDPCGVSKDCPASPSTPVPSTKPSPSQDPCGVSKDCPGSPTTPIPSSNPTEVPTESPATPLPAPSSPIASSAPCVSSECDTSTPPASSPATPTPAPKRGGGGIGGWVGGHVIDPINRGIRNFFRKFL